MWTERTNRCSCEAEERNFPLQGVSCGGDGVEHVTQTFLHVNACLYPWYVVWGRQRIQHPDTLENISNNSGLSYSRKQFMNSKTCILWRTVQMIQEFDPRGTTLSYAGVIQSISTSPLWVQARSRCLMPRSPPECRRRWWHRPKEIGG